jgi:hypothetical protein
MVKNCPKAAYLNYAFERTVTRRGWCAVGTRFIVRLTRAGHIVSQPLNAGVMSHRELALLGID